MSYYIYAIEDYAGMTSRLANRIRNHKSSGKNVEKIQLLKVFIDKKQAREYEKHLHDNCGYKGGRKKGFPNRNTNGPRKYYYIDNFGNKYFGSRKAWESTDKKMKYRAFCAQLDGSNKNRTGFIRVRKEEVEI